MSLQAHSEPWWLVTRVTGILATTAVGAALVLGLALARRRTTPRARARLAWHRLVTWAALGLISVHIEAALLDRHHVPFYVLVAPFLSSVRRVAAGTGVLAVWGLVLVAITAAWRRHLKSVWRRIHYLTYPVSALAVVHSLMGTDSLLVLMGGVVASGSVVVWWRRPPRRARPRSALLRMTLAPPSAATATVATPTNTTPVTTATSTTAATPAGQRRRFDRVDA
jgi:DMSO/TMAO reductase YedYZ heme-binding membrane subunit